MAMRFPKEHIIATRKTGDPGVGVLTIASAHTTDQEPFIVVAKTDAVLTIKCLDESTQAGVAVNAGQILPIYLLQVTAITSGTIFGIYQ